MKQSLRGKALNLRKRGWSYNIIADRLKVSKSTLSYWLRDIPYSPNKTVQKRVNDAFLKSAMSRHEIKMKSLIKAESWAKKEVGTLSDRDLMMLGLGLYIGEGSKRDEIVHIMNSDPRVLYLAIKWLRDSFAIPLKHFRLIMFIYPDNSETEAKFYWSQKTGIPIKQFEKSQVDRRADKKNDNRRKLLHGTAHIKIRACGNADFGVLLHRRILALISEVCDKARV